MLLHVRGKRCAVDGFEDLLEGRRVHQILVRQLLDRHACIEVLREECVHLVDNAHLLGRIVLRFLPPLTEPEKQRLRSESAPRQRRLCALPVEKVENPAQRVVRGNARYGLLRAVQIIQPLGRHIRAQKTLGRLLGELFEIKPQAKARKALVRLDRSR